MDSYGRNIVTLTGDVDSWDAVISLGHSVAKVEGVKNVVSELTVNGSKPPQKDYTPFVKKGNEIGVIDSADVVIIGLGITGCGIARELAKYDLKIIAIDSCEDVGTVTTKANNGGVHASGAQKPGTLKAKFCVEGNKKYDKWAEELGFDFERVGALTYVTDTDHMNGILSKYKNCVLNGEANPQLLGTEETLEIAPEIKTVLHETPVASLWLPSQARVQPQEVCVALAENAIKNGVRIILRCTAGDILVENGHIVGVVTDHGIINTSCVIDAAGIYSDDVADMAGDKTFTIHNRRGTILILDKEKAPLFKVNVGKYTPQQFNAKNANSNGGGTNYTVHGNILIGPSAEEVIDKENTETSAEALEYCLSRNNNPLTGRGDIIRSFAGARPASLNEDFVVERSIVTDGFIVAGAIQSPGIGSAPAIAEQIECYVKDFFAEHGRLLSIKESYDPMRKRRIRFSDLSREEQDELIKSRPEYGRIVCRCEGITEGEIIDAIHSPLMPRTVDAIKQRTRAGMGRCQGGFCQQRVVEIIAREFGRDWVDVNLYGSESYILTRNNR